jgi:hypothetical protein
MNNIYIYILNILRKLSKSLAKKEILFEELITFLKYNKKKNYFNSVNNLSEFKDYFINIKNYQILSRLKVKVCIPFYYKKNKKNLIKVCKNLANIFSEIDLTIITNNRSFKISKDQISKKINLKFKIKMHYSSNKHHSRMMPWEHFFIMNKEFNKKKIHTLLIYRR